MLVLIAEYENDAQENIQTWERGHHASAKDAEREIITEMHCVEQENSTLSPGPGSIWSFSN